MTIAAQVRRVDRDEVFLEYTKSICPTCKAVVDAEINVRDNRVYLRTAADRRRGRPRVGVVPRRGPVDLPVHHDVVIARLTLPRAHRVVVAGEELVAVERVGWEVVVALHHDGVVALGQHGPVPCGTNHRLLRTHGREGNPPDGHVCSVLTGSWWRPGATAGSRCPNRSTVG